MANLGFWRRALIHVAASLVGAGVFYAMWLAAFLLTARTAHPAVKAIFWVLTPAMTAAGFAVGLALCERLLEAARTLFLRLFVWPFVGCAIGAAAVCWFGPMLIVFGMFGGGTVAVIARDAWQAARVPRA